MGFIERLQKKINQSHNVDERAAGSGSKPDANAQLEQGMRLERQGLPNDALACYEAAIALMPSLAQAHFNRGTIFLDRGDWQTALDAFHTALTFKPDSAGAHFNLGNAYLQGSQLEAAIAAYQKAIDLKPEFADAQRALKSALALRPGFADFCFTQGLAFQDLGQLEDAEKSYRQALQSNPEHLDARNNLGGVLLRLERAEEAVEQFRIASQAAPDNADIHMNLGDALGILGLREQALRCFQSAIEKRPGHAAAFIRLANLQGDLSQTDEAIESYRSALEVDCNSAEANLNMGILLLKRGEMEAAEACYRRALEVEPNSAETHSNLGVILKRRGQMDAAMASFQNALTLSPDFCEAHINQGTVFQALGQSDLAAACYQRALLIKPNSAEAHSNYGTVLQSQDKLDVAEASFLTALEINPDLADAHNNLGIVYSHTRRLDASVESYERAIKFKPDYAEAYSNLGGVLKDLGRLDESLRTLQHALDIDPLCATAHNNLLFIHNYLADQPAERLLAEAQRFGDMVARLAKPYTEWPNLPDPYRALRVGFVSGDLSGHPVGYFLEGVLAALASEATGKLELYAYPSIFRDDETSKRLRAACKAWHSAVGLSDAALAQRIRQDGIDILIDLSGHTANNRLPVFAWKPAPIQVSWLGYFATTGVAAMDYFVADPWTLPPDQEAYFTEKVWRLPETRLCFTPPTANVDVNALPALSNGYITFGCFNNLSKMNDAVVQLWARVLNAVPASRLFLKYQQLAEASVRQSTRERFAVHGIAAERLIFEDYVPRANYLAAYHRVDIALDPFPFPGGTTTVEALWMGIPVLTLSGERFLARQGVGLLMNAGLPDWVASDHDEYLARAVTHASDLQELAALRARLRQQVLASPIYDATRFAKHFEAALRGMWLAWCETASGKQSN